jgi:hypothetical protein
MNPVLWVAANRPTSKRTSPNLARREALVVLPAAPVWTRNHSQKVAVGILEIEAATAIIVIDLPALCLRGISPIGKASFANPFINLIELRFADQKGVVLLFNLTVGIHEIKVGTVGGRDDNEWAPNGPSRGSACAFNQGDGRYG